MNIARKKSVIKFIAVLLISLIPALFFSYMPLDMNPQGEYCEKQAYGKSKPVEGRTNYVDSLFGYEVYNPEKHENKKAFYVEKKGKDIHTAFWKSSNDPCRFTSAFWKWFINLWLIFYCICSIPFIIWFLLSALSKTCNGRCLYLNKSV